METTCWSSKGMMLFDGISIGNSIEDSLMATEWLDISTKNSLGVRALEKESVSFLSVSDGRYLW